MRCRVEYFATKAEDVGLPNEYKRHPVIGISGGSWWEPRVWMSMESKGAASGPVVGFVARLYFRQEKERPSLEWGTNIAPQEKWTRHSSVLFPEPSMKRE